MSPTDEQSRDPGGPSALPALLEVASSNHLVVSLDQQLTSRIRLGLDGYVKRFNDLAGGPGEPLNASGIDLRVKREAAGLRTWLGYSLSWFWTSAAGSDDAFAGRHLLSVGLQGDLGSRLGVDLRLSYGNGLPLTAIPLGDAAPVSEQDDVTSRHEFDQATQAARGAPPLAGGVTGDFLRLDAELYGTFERRAGERSHVFRPYVKILNALDRRDSMFYYFERWRDSAARPLAELSLLPVVGLEWRF